MLSSKLLGSVTSVEQTEFAFVTSASTSGSASATVPATADIGDVCVIFAFGAAPTASLPAGWTSVSSTASIFALRVLYKVLQSGDAGTSVIVNGITNVASYGATLSFVFRPNKDLSTVYVSSLNAQGETGTTTSSVKDTSLYPPANIILATKSDFNISYTTYSSAISGAFWNGGIRVNANQAALAAAYEIQAEVNTDRTVTPTNATSSPYQHMHSFVLNAD